MEILRTERLRLRTLQPEDAAFYLELVHQPSWVEYIGATQINSLDDARCSIATVHMVMQAAHGFSLYLVERQVDEQPMGICGLVKRDSLEEVDLGFAFLEAFWGLGYAYEAATSVLDYADRVLALARVVAITLPSNEKSIQLLEKIGMRLEKVLVLPGEDKESKFFVKDFRR